MTVRIIRKGQVESGQLARTRKEIKTLEELMVFRGLKQGRRTLPIPGAVVDIKTVFGQTTAVVMVEAPKIKALKEEDFHKEIVLESKKKNFFTSYMSSTPGASYFLQLELDDSVDPAVMEIVKEITLVSPSTQGVSSPDSRELSAVTGKYLYSILFNHRAAKHSIVTGELVWEKDFIPGGYVLNGVYAFGFFGKDVVAVISKLAPDACDATGWASHFIGSAATPQGMLCPSYPGRVMNFGYTKAINNPLGDSLYTCFDKSTLQLVPYDGAFHTNVTYFDKAQVINKELYTLSAYPDISPYESLQKWNLTTGEIDWSIRPQSTMNYWSNFLCDVVGTSMVLKAACGHAPTTYYYYSIDMKTGDILSTVDWGDYRGFFTQLGPKETFTKSFIVKQS